MDTSQLPRSYSQGLATGEDHSVAIKRRCAPTTLYWVRIRRPVDCLGGAAGLPAQWPVGVGAVPPNVARLPIAGWPWATHHLSPGVPNTARGYSAR
jgi:hypothetical protein